MRIALEDLNPEQLVVLYPGPKAYTLAERVRVVPINFGMLGKHLAEQCRARPRQSRHAGYNLLTFGASFSSIAGPRWT